MMNGQLHHRGKLDGDRTRFSEYVEATELALRMRIDSIGRPNWSDSLRELEPVPSLATDIAFVASER